MVLSTFVHVARYRIAFGNGRLLPWCDGRESTPGRIASFATEERGVGIEKGTRIAIGPGATVGDMPGQVGGGDAGARYFGTFSRSRAGTIVGAPQSEVRPLLRPAPCVALNRNDCVQRRRPDRATSSGCRCHDNPPGEGRDGLGDLRVEACESE